MRCQSFDLQFLQTLEQRTTLTADEKQQLHRLVRGYEGELRLDELLQNYFGHADLVVDDVTLSFGKEMVQIDKLLLVGKVVYLLDAKNYQGSYFFRQNSWYSGQRLLANNIFRQIDRASDLLQQIFQAEGLELEVKRVLLFMAPEVKVELQQQVVQKVLCFPEIPAWLLALKSEADIYPPQNLGVYQKTLRKYTVAPYRPQHDFSCQSERNLHTGICCPQCNNFEWQQTRFYLRCMRCGYCQSKELAYVRTICDYGVLYFKRNLRRKELKKFLGESLSESYLRIQLKKHFQQLGRGCSPLGYHNVGIRFNIGLRMRKDILLI